MKVREELVISAARQTAPTDKLLDPPRRGGKWKKESAELCIIQ
jgi:hypothetical protein